MKKNLLTLTLILLYTISSYAQAPTITSFSPASGPVGTLVTITGSNLSGPTAFTIGGVAAIRVSGTATSLVGMVMTGAATGSVSVTTSGGTVTSGSTFTTISPVHSFRQQGPQLIGSHIIDSLRYSVPACYGTAGGASVSVSADGNTAIVGGYGDSLNTGAIWMFARTNGIWSQLGPKISGPGRTAAPYPSRFGFSVGMSADGNTAVAGAPLDSNGQGAIYIYPYRKHVVTAG